MNPLRPLAFTAIALSAVAAYATGPSSPTSSSTLARTVAHLESRYEGEVVAIQLDASGDKSPHYHVDMQFPESGIARVDVDAATLAIVGRSPEPLETGDATLAEVTALIAEHVPGQVASAELDTSHGTLPHYDVDVRLPQGDMARLVIDAASRAIGWRTPAIL
jgi:uncharacterized membrane protein YkoI